MADAHMQTNMTAVHHSLHGMGFMQPTRTAPPDVAVNDRSSAPQRGIPKRSKCLVSQALCFHSSLQRCQCNTACGPPGGKWCGSSGTICSARGLPLSTYTLTGNSIRPSVKFAHAGLKSRLLKSEDRRGPRQRDVHAGCLFAFFLKPRRSGQDPKAPQPHTVEPCPWEQ